jgi:gamma-glutamyltranspeptidase/glutathione hydrolase
MAGLQMVEAMQSIERAGLTRAQPYDRDPATLYRLLQIAKAMNSRGDSATKPEHTDAIVAVDERGNVAAVVHSINTVTWGSTGIFVNGVSIPDSASFQQQVIARLPGGSRLPATIHPGLAIKDNKVALGFGSTGSGSGTRSIAALLSVLGHNMTPQQAIDLPGLGAFDVVDGVPPELAATVAEREFSDAYLKSLEDLGQITKPWNALRGYWLGVSIDPKTGLRRAGAMREFPQLGGGAAGY